MKIERDINYLVLPTAEEMKFVTEKLKCKRQENVYNGMKNASLNIYKNHSIRRKHVVANVQNFCDYKF